MTHVKWLDETIKMAIQNVKDGSGPFAAIVVKGDNIIGRGVNLVHSQNDPSAHAELLAIRDACATLESTDLSDCILYASGEPCLMCLSTAYWATLEKIYYACSRAEALNVVELKNPLKNFIGDQTKSPEERTVPFIQLKTADTLEPFIEWKQLN